MEPVHVLLGVESPLSVIVLEGVGHGVMRVLEGEGHRLVRVLEWEEERIWRGVGSREGGTGRGAVPVLRAVAIALSCEFRCRWLRKKVWRGRLWEKESVFKNCTGVPRGVSHLLCWAGIVWRWTPFMTWSFFIEELKYPLVWRWTSVPLGEGKIV